MPKSAATVVLTASLVLFALGCGYCGPNTSKRGSAAKLHILRAADEADVIVVGALPQEVALTTVTGKVAGVAGYRIDAVRFIKGASVERVSNAEKAASQGVFINAMDLSRSGDQEILLPKAEVGSRFIYFLTQQRSSFPVSPRLKPVSRDAWFVPASPEAIKRVEDALPKAQVWGEPSSGLAAGIRTLKRSYAPGEPVRIELHLKNTGDRTLLVPQQRLMFNDYYPFLEFSGGTGITVFPGGGADLGASTELRAFLEKPVGAGQKDAMLPVELKPGQVYMERIDLNSWQWATSDGLRPFRSGVKLTMHGSLIVAELDKDFRYTKAETDAMWTGQVEIPWFELVFSSGPAVRKEPEKTESQYRSGQ